MQPEIYALVGTFCPIRFRFQTALEYPSTTSFQNSFVKVTFPQSATFAAATGAYLECKFNDQIAAKCTSTTGPPFIVTAYFPVGMIIQNTEIVLNVNIVDPNDGTSLGFEAPGSPGDYQFQVDLFQSSNTSTPVESWEPWVHVAEKNFESARIESSTYSPGMPNVLTVHLESRALGASSADPSGILYLEFPYDAAGVTGFKENLGIDDFYSPLLIGYSLPGRQVDCPVVGAGVTNTVGIAATAYECYLEPPDKDVVRLRVSGFNAVSADEKFNFRVLVKNPEPGAGNLTDLKINVISYEMVKTTGVWTEKEFITVDYIETISGDATPPTAKTDDTDENTYINASVGPGTQLGSAGAGSSVTLNIRNNGVDTASGYSIIQYPSLHFNLPDEVFDTATVKSNAATSHSNFPTLGFIFVHNPANAINAFVPADGTVFVFTDAQNNGPDFEDVARITGSYLKSWLIDSNKLTRIIVTHDDTTFASSSPRVDSWATKDIITIGGAQASGTHYASQRELFQFKLKATTFDMTQGGMIKVTWPSSTIAATTFHSETCRTIPLNQDLDIASIYCEISGNDILIKGWPAAASDRDITTTEFYFEIEVTHGATAGTSGDQFMITAYRTESDGADKEIFIRDNSCGTLTITSNGAVGTVGTMTSKVTYRDQEPVRNNVTDRMVGPITFSIKPNATVTKATGFVKISLSQGVIRLPQDTGTEMRCIWKDVTGGNIEYLASGCEFTAGPPNEFKIYTPRYHDILSTKDYEVTITTINALINGISFDDAGATKGIDTGNNFDEFKLEFIVDNDGSGTTQQKDTKYFSVYGNDFTTCQVRQDHGISGHKDRFHIKLKASAPWTAATTGNTRMVVEFPVDVFGEDLGSGIADGERFPCVMVGTWSTAPITCTLRKGVTGTTYNPQVWVNGYDTDISAAGVVEFQIPNVQNPTVSTADADAVFSSARVFVTDVTNIGYPGERVKY